MAEFTVRPLDAADADWVRRFMLEQWRSDRVISTSGMHHPHTLPGFIAEQEGERIGLITYHLRGDACEIVTLDSLRPGQGIGTALIEQVKLAAQMVGCQRVWLITTNDNLRALRFYQRRGFVLKALHANILEKWRTLKPEISLIGMDGIPLRDAIELEISLPHT